MKIFLQVLLLAICGTAVAAADEIISDAAAAKLMTKYNCQSCHNAYSALSGPSFVAVSQKYASDSQARLELQSSILNGSSGVWGSGTMPPVDVPQGDLKKLVAWILQLM
jgi:cytochrome c